MHTDHLDAPRMLTDAAGIPSWRAAYDAFGIAHVDPDPDGDGNPANDLAEFNLRFPGQYYDAETGLHYNLLRYYDPATGRYVSADPLGQVGGSNLYPYAANSPVVWTDPHGVFVLPPKRSPGGGGPWPGQRPPGNAPPRDPFKPPPLDTPPPPATPACGDSEPGGGGGVPKDPSEPTPKPNGDPPNGQTPQPHDIVPVDMPGTEPGGPADIGAIIQEALAQQAQQRSLDKIEREIARIQKEFLGQPLDVFAIITIEGHVFPHPTELFKTLLVPLRTEVTSLPLPPGARPAVLNPQIESSTKFRITVGEQVLRNGRPIRSGGF